MQAPRFQPLNKVPFWIADGTLLAAAAALVYFGGRPLRVWEAVGVVVCVAVGGVLAVLPFLKEYAGWLALAEAERVAGVSEKLDGLESVADRIAGATGQWQAVQERAHQTAEQAREVVERLARESEQFATVVSRTADTEKQNLKLEVDKLRRGEGEWLQAVGRVMDHVFALHVAASRSGQAAVAQQIDRFHAACRDALRRVGFSAVVATPDEPFDPRRHQVVDGTRPGENARVDETVAPGFLYQGHLLRPVMVRVGGGGEPGSPAMPAASPALEPAGGPEPGAPVVSGDGGAADRGTSLKGETGESGPGVEAMGSA